MIFLEPNMAVIGRVDLDDENVIASKDLIAVAKKAGTFVGDEAKNIIDFRASYARISEKMDQRMIDGLNYLNATYKYDSDTLVADNTKFTISNLDASDKLVALYTNIKADRKLDKDDVFGYYKLSSIGKASNQEIEIFQLFKDRPVETATVGWVGVGNMSYNVFVPYYPMLIDSMYSGYQVSTASAKFTTEKPDTFCTYGTSWAQDAEGNWQRVSGFKAYPSNWKDSYEFVTAKSDEKGNNLSLSTTINAGDSLTVTLKAKSGSTPEGDTVRVTFYGTDGKAVSTYNVTSGSSIDSKKVSDAQSKADNKTGYTFKGWKIDNKGDLYTSAQVAKLVIKGNVEFYAYLEKDTTTTNNKFPYKVYLHIFKDNKVDDPAKTINITEGIALDGKVTLDEVKTVVKNYYTAKTSDGIKYDGMYMAKGNWVGNFVNDTQKYDTISDTNELRKESEVHINVMITNANAKSTTNEKADKTNPKTGDMIFIPVIFMVVSGAAIAGVYFYNKKRSAR